MTTSKLIALQPKEFWPAFFAAPPAQQNELALIAKQLSRGWFTCACCALKYARRAELTEGSPINQDLDDSGYLFYLEIEKGRYQAAADRYIRIQGLVAMENALVT